MISRNLHSLWSEPAIIKARSPDRWGWWLLLIFSVAAIAEGLFSSELEWRVGNTLITLGMLLGLLWRYSHPMLVLVLTFVGMTLLDLLARFHIGGWQSMMTHIYVLILPYTLVRWASGKHIVIGLGLVTVTYILWMPFSRNSLADSIAGGMVFLFPAILAAAARFRERAANRELEQFKMREREQLARELHDSVAHYVSAIAVQAQAGLAVANQQPQAPLTALKTIENSARQALGELRAMVRTLRQDDEADVSPQPTVFDVPKLAEGAVSSIPILVSLEGQLDDLSPAVSGAIYRLAQESITNAQRHARQARQIRVTVVGHSHSVQLSVQDDGSGRRLTGASTAGAGYGLVGMSERVALLGGTFTAGWQQGSGWCVVAELPKQGVA